MDCQMIEENIRSGFSSWTKVTSLNSGGCRVRLPFWDGAGDPIDFAVSIDAGKATIDDAGSIAGLLFSLGLDEVSTPAFKLLNDLRRTHDLEIDFDNGLVKITVSEDNLYRGIAEMAKVVLAMHTVVPHIRVTPRPSRSFGPRLKSKIAKRYRELKILGLVHRSYKVEGATVPVWPIDYHWTVGHNGSSYAVNVVAADLGVADPFAKAYKIAAMSVDTREHLRSGSGMLRVVFESQNDSAQSLEAADFLRCHSSELDYRVFDLQNREENSEFYDSSFKELMTCVPKAWMDLLSARVN